MQTTIRALLGASLVVAAFGVAVAKLPPAPPLTDEQKAAKAAKDKADADTAKAQLTKAEDHAASKYIADQKAKGITVTPQLPLGAPPSPDAGKSLPAQPEKASNAHSPPQK
jgi:hypothetical protein